MKSTPIILNNFNRLTSTRNMYEFLKNRNFTRIVILDNASTYPPLLDWYACLKDDEVIRFPVNYGAHCLFESGYLENIDNEYIVYSDCDLELNPQMPDDFLEMMKALMQKYSERKIGLALRIDDVPESYYKNFFTGTIDWEKQFWMDEVEKDVYRALVDTTFCLLHKPENHDLRALRIAGNCTARHLPWYQDYSDLKEEERYFVETANMQSNFRNGYVAWSAERRQKPDANIRNEMENKYFIGVYTNEVKDYCDERFFANLYAVSKGQPVFVVDNSSGKQYYRELQSLFRENLYNNFSIYHLDVPEYPVESRFQRNVCDSANYLRDLFLRKTTLPYFLIIESDVVSPDNLLATFESSISQLNIQSSDWGIVGGLYYYGFHNYDFDTSQTTLERTAHCLSGCTVYKRSLIEKYPFRYDPSNLAPFPDAFISYDAGETYSLWNEHQIKCEHLHNPLNGARVRSDPATEIPCLMPHQMEPFNGDTFIELEFLKLKEQFAIETAIETGTCFGGTTKFLGKHFKRVISLEVNKAYLQIARTWISPLDNVHTYCGSSEEILGKVLDREAPVNDHTIFYLDAHWEAHCPLQDELRIMAEHQLRPVIAIHDFQVPGQPGLSYDSYGGQPFSFNWLKPSFDNIYGEVGYDYYYNSERSSTEIKVGIIYITPRTSKVNLFVNYYNHTNPARQVEINECLSRNISNSIIDKIYLVVGNGQMEFFGLDQSSKVEKVICSERPTFSYLLMLADTRAGGDDITIISNADIYFDEHNLSLVKRHLQPDTCFVLSRWERESDGTLRLFDREDSQDSWIFRGRIKQIDNCHFTLGRLGCDNAICHRIEAAGYSVKNPSRDIQSVHVHNSGIRNYIPLDYSQMVERPYKVIHPEYLEYGSSWVTEIATLRANGQQSQYGEDAIIEHIFKHIGLTNRYLVDLGASAYGDSTMCNTRKLIQSGWEGYGVDIKNKGESWIIERFIKPGNILDIMGEQNTPKEFDFLNLDIDSCDFWVLKEVLNQYSPRCICTEFNGTLNPEKSIILQYEDGYVWDETNKYGYSFSAGEKLLSQHGYRIIYNMLNQNLFAVKKELVTGLFFKVTASQVQYHPQNPNAIWETY